MPSLLFTSSPESAALALSELRDLTGNARLQKWLAPGIGLAESALDWDELVVALQTRPPIWTRHIHPVQARGPINNNALDLLTLESLTQTALLHLDTEHTFSVQTRLLGEGLQWQYSRFDINERLAALIASWGAPLDVRAPYQILSITLTPTEAYLGLSLARHNLSDWAGGERRFKREPEQISRAEFKLLEALETFGIEPPFDFGRNAPSAQDKFPGGVVLDMGAAPGGWSRLMVEFGCQVVAVDPARLDPRLAATPQITYLGKTVQDYLPTRQRFDLILNDMRMDARDSARLMVEAAAALKPGGQALMTLKLPEERPAATAEHALKILQTGFAEVRARQLFHNRSEITVAMRQTHLDNQG